VKTFPENNSISRFNVHETDDTFKSLLARYQVKIIQLLVGRHVVRLKMRMKLKAVYSNTTTFWFG
jgi:hypothetical protein